MAESFNPDAPLGDGKSEVRYCTHPAHQGDAALPATTQFFKIKQHDENGTKYSRYCRACLKREETESQKSLVEAAKKLVADNALRKAKKTPHFADLMEDVYRELAKGSGKNGRRHLAEIIAGFITDDSPQNRVSRRATAMKVFEATQKLSESEDANEIKKQTTTELRSQLLAIAKAVGVRVDDMQELEELEKLTLDEPQGDADEDEDDDQ